MPKVSQKYDSCIALFGTSVDFGQYLLTRGNRASLDVQIGEDDPRAALLVAKWWTYLNKWGKYVGSTIC
jgi:hypothetical protein